MPEVMKHCYMVLQIHHGAREFKFWLMKCGTGIREWGRVTDRYYGVTASTLILIKRYWYLDTAENLYY